MLKLLGFLITGCWHKWETVEQRDLTSSLGSAKGQRIYLKCQHCGIWKKQDLI